MAGSFDSMLHQELAGLQKRLQELYGTRDRLLNQEAPKLWQRYMDVMGKEEEAVLTMELELSLKKKRAALIKEAKEKGMAIDMSALDRRLNEARQQGMAIIKKRALPLGDMPKLSNKLALPRTIAPEDPGDYALARELFSSFEQSEEEARLLESIKYLEEQAGLAEEEIKEIQKRFPFSMRSALESSMLTETYLSDLRVRRAQCEKEGEALNAQAEDLA